MEEVFFCIASKIYIQLQTKKGTTFEMSESNSKNPSYFLGNLKRIMMRKLLLREFKEAAELGLLSLPSGRYLERGTKSTKSTKASLGVFS